MKPVLQALLLAERIYEDLETGKKIITGIFSSVIYTRTENEGAATVERPSSMVMTGSHPGSPSLYINLTEVRGQTPLTLSYVDLEDGREIMRLEFEVTSPDPLATHEIVVRMPMLPISHAGVYAIELLHKEELIGSLRIHAEERTSGLAGE